MRVDARVINTTGGARFSRIGEYIPTGHHYIICAQWRHPQTRIVYKFYSDHLVELPKSYPPGSFVYVLIDPDNPRRYYMEL